MPLTLSRHSIQRKCVKYFIWAWTFSANDSFFSVSLCATVQMRELVSMYDIVYFYGGFQHFPSFKHYVFGFSMPVNSFCIENACFFFVDTLLAFAYLFSFLPPIEYYEHCCCYYFPLNSNWSERATTKEKRDIVGSRMNEKCRAKNEWKNPKNQWTFDFEMEWIDFSLVYVCSVDTYLFNVRHTLRDSF